MPRAMSAKGHQANAAAVPDVGESASPGTVSDVYKLGFFHIPGHLLYLFFYETRANKKTLT